MSTIKAFNRPVVKGFGSFVPPTTPDTPPDRLPDEDTVDIPAAALEQGGGGKDALTKVAEQIKSVEESKNTKKVTK